VGQGKELEGKEGETSRGGDAGCAAAPEIQMPEGEGSMGGSEAAEQATPAGKEENSGVTAVANTDVRVRAIPGPQRAAAATSQRDIQMDGWGVQRE